MLFEFSFLFYSCKQILLNNDFKQNNSNFEHNKTSSLTLNLDFNDNLPYQYKDFFDSNSSKRSAIPDSPDFNTLFWKFILKNNDSNIEYELLSENLIQKGYSFQIPLYEGNWNIEAFGYQTTSNNLSATNNSIHNPFYILYGKINALEIANNTNYCSTLNVNFINSSGTGSVFLQIATTNSEISKVTITNSNTNLDDTYFVNENGIILINKSDIQSGNYLCNFTFWIKNLYCFSIPQIINVRNNITTSKWENNCFYSQADNEMPVFSKEITSEFIQKVFFVKGNNGILQTHLQSFSQNQLDFSSSNTPGTWVNPFLTIQDAVDYIRIINDGVSEYTVYIDGIIKDSSLSPYTIENNFSFINISSDLSLTIIFRGLSSNAEINVNRTQENSGRVFTISGKVFVTIDNIIITGGYTNENGGGIYLTTQSENESIEKNNLTLSGTTKIIQNHTNNSGGGIYVDNGTVLLNSSSVEISNNFALEKGGGICLLGLSDKDSRKLNVTGGKISNNSSISSSGKEGVGGGIYSQFATLKIENCIISNNLAANGGGISIAQNSIISISNTTISQNKASYLSGKGGGGIFASGVSAKLYLKSGCFITNNYSASEKCLGGGIRITSTNVYIENNVHITDNICSDNKTSNLSLANNKYITINSNLENTLIGITTSSEITENSSLAFTKKFGNFENNLPQFYFFPDDEIYQISLSFNGEAELSKKMY